jgi:hypothetical protein
VSALAGQIADPGDYNREIKKLIARAGPRVSSSSTTTTEIGVLRVDGIALKAGRHYRVTTSTLLIASSVSTDVVTVRFRSTTDGSTATTSSTQLDLNSAIYNFTAGPGMTMAVDINPVSDIVLSLLLTVARTAGTGNVSLVGGVTFPIGFWVDDMGPDTGSIGISL